MKWFVKCLCLILALSFCLAIPAAAEETAPYGSSYFGSRDAYLWRTSSTSCQAWFEVTAVRGMAELGAQFIDIEESSDGVNWSVVASYNRSNYSNLIKTNTVDHTSYVTFSRMKPDCQYRMYVRLYAKDSSGNTATSSRYGYFLN